MLTNLLRRRLRVANKEVAAKYLPSPYVQTLLCDMLKRLARTVRVEKFAKAALVRYNADDTILKGIL